MERLINDIYIVNTTALEFRKALKSDMKDLEDAYQYFSALKIRGLKYFITRNIKHYKKKDVTIVTPELFIKAQTDKDRDINSR